MNTVLEKLQFVEARMQALEEQLKLTKMEALEQRSRAEVAETWLKIKNRKIVFLEELEYDEPPPPPSKNTSNWDTVTIPCQVSVERLPSISPKSDRRISLPSPTKSPKSERRTSLPSVGRRSLVSPKRTSLAKQCWPTVLDADDVKYMGALYAP